MSAQKKQLLSKLRGQTFLVIDTQKETMQNLKEMLESSVKIIYSDDSNDAIQKIQDKKPNIVFINCDTSSGAQTSLDGYDISQSIKQLEAYGLIPCIPVILFGKQSQNLNKQKFITCSADSLIATPLNEQTLIENLSKLQMYKHIIEQ